MARRIKNRPFEAGHQLKSRRPVGATTHQNQKPHFSLEFVVNSHCITRCEKADRASFANKLRKISELTWQQLRDAPAHGLGYEPIPREGIRQKIPSNVTDDVASFFSFRFAGKKAMVGYRTERTFHILWFDRAFNVYDHG